MSNRQSSASNVAQNEARPFEVEVAPAPIPRLANTRLTLQVNPLHEPRLPLGVRSRVRQSRREYDFLSAGPPGVALIAAGELDALAATAGNLGVSLRRVLIGEGRMRAEDYVAALARHLAIPYLADPAGAGLRAGEDPLNLQQAWAEGMLEGQPTVALDATLMSPRGVRYLARRLSNRGFSVRLVTPQGLRACVIASAGPALLRHAVSGVARLDPEASARAGSWLWQALALAAIAGFFIGLVVIGGLSAQWLLTVLGTLPFLLTVVLRLSALLMHRLPPRLRARSVPAGEDRALPVYTVLVPLFREAKVLPDLVDALRHLDYPGFMAQTPLGKYGGNDHL